MDNKIITSASKIDLENQFDVDLQISWCDCDCDRVFKKKDKYTADALANSFSGQIVVKNPTAAQIKKGQETCAETGNTYCYATGTKKTTDLW